MSFVEYYWQGKGPLWKVYWLYGVLTKRGTCSRHCGGWIRPLGRSARFDSNGGWPDDLYGLDSGQRLALR